MKKISTAIIAIAALLIVAIALSACGQEARQDADKSGQKVDRSAAEVVAMPDVFRNVAHKCDGHGHRVYVTSRGGEGGLSQLFVIDDASCGTEAP